jgi:hypothetical protein
VLNLVTHLSTAFHRELATAAWLAALAAHVEAEMKDRAGRYRRGEGRVSSEYNEARFMGPNSLVKYESRVDAVMSRDDTPRPDRYRIWVRYRPDAHAFLTRQTELDTLESRLCARQEAERLEAEGRRAAEQLRERWQGREAIYLESGALRIRVVDVFRQGDRFVAEVEEVPTPGLRNTLLRVLEAGKAPSNPIRWSLSMPNDLAEDYWWASGWTLVFAPDFVQRVTALAEEWPADLSSLARYCELGVLWMEERSRALRERRSA